MPIQYVPYNEIDKLKWDDCIVHATNSLIYAQSFYLDNIAGTWDALILDDYHALMPLVWRKKWGIKYLYQPSFIQQQGVFFKENIGTDILESFISKAFEEFTYADVTINYANADLFLPAEILATPRTNFIVPLQKDYEITYQNYHPNFTKSLRRIKKFAHQYKHSIDYKKTINWYHELYAKKLESVTEKDIAGFKNICAQLSVSNDCLIREAHSAEGTLLAAILLLKDKHRLYNIISCITEEGKKQEVNYFLYDKLIQEFSGTNMVLDLEGSDMKGVANFYKKFNPIYQPYTHLKKNDLHPVLKLFKR